MNKFHVLFVRFPLELHIVMYKENYGTFDNATHYKDGLAVLAVFYEVRVAVNHTG
jgi:hypothetical protein